MSVLEAILLGFMQGVTSFLPVSSSGHVVILEQFLKMESNNTVFLTVMLNIGTLIAILLAFREDIMKTLKATVDIWGDLVKNAMTFFMNTTKGQNDAYIKLLNNNYRRFTGLIFISIIPTAIIGGMIQNVSFPTLISLRSRAISSTSGTTIRQGPHQGAQKSRRTGLSEWITSS